MRVFELARRKSAAIGGRPLEGTFSESQRGWWRAVEGRGGREADVTQSSCLNGLGIVLILFLSELGVNAILKCI